MTLVVDFHVLPPCTLDAAHINVDRDSAMTVQNDSVGFFRVNLQPNPTYLSFQIQGYLVKVLDPMSGDGRDIL